MRTSEASHPSHQPDLNHKRGDGSETSRSDAACYIHMSKALDRESIEEHLTHGPCCQ